MIIVIGKKVVVKISQCRLIQLLEFILNSNFLVSLPLRLGFFIVSRSELVFLNSNLCVKEAISMKNAIM